MRMLEEYLEIIEKNLSLFTEADDKWGVTQVLLAIQEASLMVFNDLQRIFVYPSDGGTIRFEGFVPAHSLDALKGSMGSYVVAAEPVKTQGKDVAYIPTLLVNPRLISVFESLTLQRGLPKYGEVDPTPILALVFPFFFGIMFADVGHGIALLAFGLYLVYRTAYRNWGELILILSFSTAAFGFVRGSFFGVPFTSPLEQVDPPPGGPQRRLHALIHPVPSRGGDTHRHVPPRERIRHRLHQPGEGRELPRRLPGQAAHRSCSTCF